MPNVGATTAGAIVTAAKQRADMENSAFISDAEWLSLVNASCAHLYEKIVEAYGNDYELATAYSLTTDGVSDRFALPADFFKLLGVDLSLSNPAATSAGWVTVWRFNFAARNQFTLPNIQTLWGRTNLKYRLAGGNIWFIPLPAGGQTLRLWYAPRFTPFTAASDSFDFFAWEEWAVNDAAMKARAKEQTPIDDLLRLQAAQEERLTHAMENRDAGAPATTVDVYRANGGGGYGGGWGGWEP